MRNNNSSSRDRKPTAEIKAANPTRRPRLAIANINSKAELKRPAWANFFMERAFWDGLREICETQAITGQAFIQEACARHVNYPTGTAVRVQIAQYFQALTERRLTDTCNDTVHQKLHSKSNDAAIEQKYVVPEWSVLLVDDDPDVLLLVKASLSKAGIDVTVAETGDRALAILARNAKVDAIIADYAMVGMNGIELLVQSKQMQPQLGGLLITGYANAQEFGELPTGIDVLRKPFLRANLIEKVMSLFRSATHGASERFAKSLQHE